MACYRHANADYPRPRIPSHSDTPPDFHEGGNFLNILFTALGSYTRNIATEERFRPRRVPQVFLLPLPVVTWTISINSRFPLLERRLTARLFSDRECKGEVKRSEIQPRRSLNRKLSQVSRSRWIMPQNIRTHAEETEGSRREDGEATPARDE
ncbi:hypothetical protein LY78DRAFT_384813 [Colletotrichum sublineola]|nr:hypothetical protein LY78DRAFT_384813 [Colletotrichum sublineola]